MPTKLLRKITAFLFPTDLDNNENLRSSSSDDELEQDLDNVLMQ